MSNSTAIAIRDDQVTFDDLQTRALAHIGVETANRADLAVFFHTCKRTGLDPFARQIYMIKRDGKQTMQTGIDGLRLVAQRTAERTHGTFGYEDSLWCGSDGVWHDVWLSTDPPAAAKVTVVRDGQRFPGLALYSEYVQTFRDKQTREVKVTKTWSEKAALMLAKCAEAAALRKAFPQDLSGVYEPDELRSETAAAAPRVTASDFVKVDTDTGEVLDGEVVPDPQTGDGADQPSEVAPSPPRPRPGTEPSAAKRAKMFASFADAGFTSDPKSESGRRNRLAYIAHAIGREVESSNELNSNEVGVVIAMLEADAQNATEPGEAS